MLLAHWLRTEWNLGQLNNFPGLFQLLFAASMAAATVAEVGQISHGGGRFDVVFGALCLRMLMLRIVLQ